MTNTIRQLQLIKRTAWVNANRKPRAATKDEADRYGRNIVFSLVYAAVLNGFIYDLESAMKEDKTMDDSAKKVIRLLHRTAQNAHGDIYTTFGKNVEGFGESYNRSYDRVSDAIEANINLEGGERYYNIVLALLRLIRKYNQASGRFKGASLVALEEDYRRFAALPLPYRDYHETIEAIIESASHNVIGIRTK